MHFAPWRTLRGRLVVTALLVELVMLGMLVGNSLRLLRESMGAQAERQAEQISPVLVAALVAPLAQFDYATVKAVIDESQAIRGISYVAVLDASGRQLAVSDWTLRRPRPASTWTGRSCWPASTWARCASGWTCRTSCRPAASC